MIDKRLLLQKYIQGKCTPEELAFLRTWIKSEEAATPMEEIIEGYWNTSEESAAVQLDSRQLFDKIELQLPEGKEKIVPQHKFRIPLIWKYAAIISMLIMASVFFTNRFTSSKEKLMAKEEILVIKEAKRGQKRTFELEDGTRVVLNAESNFSYPTHFSDTLRLVYLEGEAFFDVTPDPHRPFVVKTSTVETRVLGTSFNICAYPSNTVTNVALVTGKISVQDLPVGNTLGPLVLSPGEMAVYDKTSQMLSEKNFDVKSTTAWKDGVLYFQESDYTEITQTLGRWYDVTFKYQPGYVPQWQYNGEFEAKSLEYVLESLSYACKFSYSIQGKQVIIN